MVVHIKADSPKSGFKKKKTKLSEAFQFLLLIGNGRLLNYLAISSFQNNQNYLVFTYGVEQ